MRMTAFSDPVPSSPSDAAVVFECSVCRLDPDVEVYVAQAIGSERMAASLRIEPVRGASRRAIERLGAAWLPDLDGALVQFFADDDPAGHAAILALLARACAQRSQERDEAAWIGRCPTALRPTLRALGWRDWPPAGEAAVPSDPMVLLLDDPALLVASSSPLAHALTGRPPRPERAAEILGELEIRAPDPARYRNAG